MSIVLFSCGKESKCLKSNGSQTIEERIVSGFNTIEIKGKLDVELIDENTNEISISGGENLMKFITTEVNDSTLIVDNKNKCNWLRSYKNGKITLKISVARLKHLKVKGLCKVYSNNSIFSDKLKIEFITGISELDLTLSTNELELIVHDGGGDIILKGKTENLNVFNNGYAKLDMLNLSAGYIFLANKSQNQTLINSKNRIDVEIYNVGDVYYAGNPTTVNLNSYSSGELIKLN